MFNDAVEKSDFFLQQNYFCEIAGNYKTIAAKLILWDLAHSNMLTVGKHHIASL